MLQAIKRQFVIELSGWLWGIVTLLATSASGMFMMSMIAKFSDENECWYATGTIMGAAILVIYILIMIGAGIGFDFNLEVSMGCTRRHFFGSFYIVNGLFCVIFVFAVMGVYAIENALAAVLYPDMENGLDILPYIVRGGIPVVLLAITVAGLAGALVMRFGMRAFWVIWVIWMLAFLGVPNICNTVADAPDSFLGRIGARSWQLIASIPIEIWLVVAALASLLSLAGTWLIIRRQQVTL